MSGTPAADQAVAAPPAVHAFDAVAATFDERYGAWASVAAQRRAVRRELLRAFPEGASLIELGGGTGEDALFLAARGRRVLVTDGASAMVERVRSKAEAAGVASRVWTRRVLLEHLDRFAATSVLLDAEHDQLTRFPGAQGVEPGCDGQGRVYPRHGQSRDYDDAQVRFDGAFSNFAALNCVADLAPVARGLALVLPEGAHALLVVFGSFAPGEVLVQLARGDARAAFRRLSRGDVAARLAGHDFTVRYPSPRAVASAFSPWFRLTRARGIGVFVPPSAAEPAVSRFPRVLAVLEALDRLAAAPLAWLGDHVLLDFVRTAVPLPAREPMAGGRWGRQSGHRGCEGETPSLTAPCTCSAARPRAAASDASRPLGLSPAPCTCSVARPGDEQPARRFRDAYARHRAAEGRAADDAELLALPFPASARTPPMSGAGPAMRRARSPRRASNPVVTLERGPLARQWQVRARTFSRFLSAVLEPRAAEVAPRPLRIADLGAGNGWLCYRLARAGHAGFAIDIRVDATDGLGAAAAYGRHVRRMFPRIAGSFEAVPLASACCDIAVFNASIHYALDLSAALDEAVRVVVPGGRIAILDSPFYASEGAGRAMVEEKRRHATRRFGALAEDLMALPFIEFLTLARLDAASSHLRLTWRRHRVRYPLWYELRPVAARLRARRTPARFDVWEATVP